MERHFKDIRLEETDEVQDLGDSKKLSDLYDAAGSSDEDE
jgi:hypothetical protein